MGQKSRFKRLRRLGLLPPMTPEIQEQRRQVAAQARESQQRDSRGTDADFRRQAARTATRLGDGDTLTVDVRDYGYEKISACLGQLAEPLLADAPDDEACQVAVTLAAIAWNTAVAREENVPDLLPDLARRVPPGTDADLTVRIIESLVRRKLRLFPGDHRVITDYKLTFEDHRPYFQVACAMNV